MLDSDKVSLWILGWPQTLYIAEVGPELTILLSLSPGIRKVSHFYLTRFKRQLSQMTEVINLHWGYARRKHSGKQVQRHLRSVVLNLPNVTAL